MTGVAIKTIHRGLFGALALSRRSAFLSESGVLGVTSRTLATDDRASGCRRVRMTLSVDRWLARLDESEGEGLLDERPFGHRGGGWMPNQSLELTATRRLAKFSLDYRTRRFHLLLALPAAVAQLLR